MSRTLPHCLRALGFIAALGLASCGPPEELGPTLAHSTSELGTYVSQASQLGPTLWPVDTQVCFRFTSHANGAAVPGIDYWAARDGLLDAMRVAWGVIIGVPFIDAGLCPTGALPSNMLAIDLTGDGSGGRCNLGRAGQSGAPLSCWVGVAIVTAPATAEALAVIKRVGIHEVGHGLGFGHEQVRMASGTWEVPLCPSEQRNWQNGVDADNPDPNLLGLTVYDQRSIMNYCALDWGRPNTDYSPTSFDALGAEILYTRSAARPVVTSAAAYRRADGVLLTRVGVDVLVDWTARGALDSDYRQVTWTLDGAGAARKAGTGSIGTLSLSLSPAPAVHTVSGGFVDRYGRLFGLTSDTYTFDDTLHTALVMSSWGS